MRWDMAVTMPEVIDTIRRLGDWLLDQPGVTLVHEGYDTSGSPSLFVGVDDIADSTRQEILSRVTVPVQFVEGMKISLQSKGAE
jgi:hypothetical protein